jgi:hypothetical protein
MGMKTALRIAAWSLAGMSLVTAGFALGRYPAPTDYKGVKEAVLAAIDLAKEIDSVENRELRVSRAIIAPGGHIGLHSHQGDPTIVYVLEGAASRGHASSYPETVGSSSRPTGCQTEKVSRKLSSNCMGDKLQGLFPELRQSGLYRPHRPLQPPGLMGRTARNSQGPRDLPARQAYLRHGEDQRLPQESGDRADRSEPVDPIGSGLTR